MLELVKLALRVTTKAFDAEIQTLIDAALADLHLTGGVIGQGTEAEAADPLILTAVTTYVKYHFGECADPDKLKKSYDEQKAQLMTCTGYAEWTGRAFCR